jgi:serine/threonine protein kinase
MGDDHPILSELIVGRYKVEQELGRGGMGIVLRAQDTRLNRTVALKMLPPRADRCSEPSHRLAAEARADSALNHPGIASVYDFVDQGEDSLIVYEYVKGHTLRQELAQGRFTADQVCEIGAQLADALAEAHAHGIIHRDLKPENIMLVTDNFSRRRVKILDFGLAKHHRAPLSIGEEDTSETVSIATSPGLLVGTVNYMSPEQLEERTVDARTDIFALGLVLYEMATAINPFLGRTPSSTIANILKQPTTPVRQHTPTAPAELDRILLKCLRKCPEERYQSARELLVDLRNVPRATVEPPDISQAPEVEPSLFRRFFLLFGASPYRRWEIMHVRIFLWSLFLSYLGWRFRVGSPNGWGLTLFLLELGCIALLWVLLTLPMYMGVFKPQDMPREVWRLAPWIRLSTLALVLVTWTMAGTLVASHTGLAALLAFCGASGGFGVLFYKPVIDRAAFPEPH